MRKGKRAAQAGHATVEAILMALKKEERLTDLELTAQGMVLRETAKPETPLSEWFSYGCAKICVYVDSEQELERVAALAEEKGCGLEDLSLEELRGLSELIDEDVFVALDYDTAVARRNVPGGTGPQSVARQLENIKLWLGDKD